MSHCKDETFYLLCRKLEQMNKIDYKENMDKFSLELGEIFHYLCDYFCYAHNDKELLRCFPHICYENNLHSTAKKMEEMLNFTGYIFYSSFSFLELIEKRHKLYLSSVPSYRNDVLSSYNILMEIALKIAEELGIICPLGERKRHFTVNIS